MREQLYFVISGLPQDMQAAYPKLKRFYRGVDENEHEYYALIFSTDKSKSVPPMTMGLLCIPGAVLRRDEWQIENDNLAYYLGLTVKRVETREAMEEFGHSCEIIYS